MHPQCHNTNLWHRVIIWNLLAFHSLIDHEKESQIVVVRLQKKPSTQDLVIHTWRELRRQTKGIIMINHHCCTKCPPIFSVTLSCMAFTHLELSSRVRFSTKGFASSPLLGKKLHPCLTCELSHFCRSSGLCTFLEGLSGSWGGAAILGAVVAILLWRDGSSRGARVLLLVYVISNRSSPFRHHRQAGSDNQVPCVYIRINPCTHMQNVSRLPLCCGVADVLVLRLQPKPVRARVFSVQPSRATDQVSGCLQRL